jgi:hypothetical protein
VDRCVGPSERRSQADLIADRYKHDLAAKRDQEKAAREATKAAAKKAPIADKKKKQKSKVASSEDESEWPTGALTLNRVREVLELFAFETPRHGHAFRRVEEVLSELLHLRTSPTYCWLYFVLLESEKPS